MSVYITPSQLAHQRRVVTPVYMDVCRRLVYSVEDANDYGVQPPLYSPGDSLACLFVPTPAADAGADVPQVDATLYLPFNTVLLPDDRITMTYLHNEAVASARVYRIVAGPVSDAMTMRASLQLITE